MTRKTLGTEIQSALSLVPDDALFVPPASNDKGQYATLSVAIPPEVKALIDRTTHEGIATGKFPWKTPSELTRWCVLNSLRQLATIADDERLALPYQQIANAVEDLELTRTQIQSLYTTLARELNHLIQIQQGDAAQALLQTTLREIDTLPATPWRAWLLEELRVQYPTLLVSRPKPADLHPTSGRDIVKTATRTRKKKRAGTVAQFLKRRS